MTRNVFPLIGIFFLTTAAWMILGTTIAVRTGNAGSSIEPRVASSWGGEQQQSPPAATTSRLGETQVQETVNGQTIVKTSRELVATPLPLERSRIRTILNLEQRRKGLLWFPTYRVAFAGQYLFRNTTDQDEVLLKLTLPDANAIYDDLVFRVDGEQVPITVAKGVVTATVRRPRGSAITLDTGYRSHGLNSWSYSFGEGAVQVRDFVLDMTTDFAAIDFPPEALSPSIEQRSGRGWSLRWSYSNLVTGSAIGMLMPQKAQPGPLAERVSFFAPVSLLFFFFLVFMITSLKGINLHPIHYFFLAASFFAFHLLLAYLADHISIHLAFAICSAVSVFLVVSYLRIVAGPRFAFVEAASAQVIFLVGFSYAFFLPGYTGLAIAIGAIITLFVVMQMTARVDWFAKDAAVAR